MNDKKTISLALSMIATLGLLSPSARAADGKSYPASFCRPFYNASAAVLNTSAIGNSSTADVMGLDCPVIQDGDGHINGVNLAVLDRNSGAGKNVSCTLVATKFWDVTDWMLPFAFFNNRGTLGMPIKWQTLALPGGDAGPASSVYVSCSLPAATASGASFIGQYFSEEP